MKVNQIVSLVLLPGAIFVGSTASLFGIGFMNVGSFIDAPSMQINFAILLTGILVGSNVLEIPAYIGGTVLCQFSSQEVKKRAISFWELSIWSLFCGAGIGSIIGLILLVGGYNGDPLTIGPNIAITLLTLFYFFLALPFLIAFRYRALSSEVVVCSSI